MWSIISRKPLLFILLSAFALRIAAAGALQHQLDHTWNRSFLIEGDANGYWELGRKIAHGEAYEIGDRKVLRMPGFPAVLAISMTLAGESLLFARILMGVIGTAACGLVFCLGTELFDRKIGLLASGLSAILPTFVGFSVLILSETLFAVTLLASLWFMAKLIKTGFTTNERQRGIGLSLTVGVMIAAACYVRPSWLLVGPLFGVLYLFSVDNSNRKAALFRSGLVLVGLYLALTPWAYRNWQVSGHWTVTTLWAGPSLYDGLNPDAKGDSDMAFIEKDNLSQQEMSEYDIDQHYRHKAKQFVIDHPGRTIELAFIKLWRFWKPWPNAQQFQHIGLRIVVALFFIPIVLFALLGWRVHFDKYWTWILLLGPVFYFSAIHMVFVGSLRYRLPAEYALCILSVAGLKTCLLDPYFSKHNATIEP